MLAGAGAVVFRLGLSMDPSIRLLLGVVVFLGGYGCVITGSSWWLKAKGWNDAVVFIALMPVTIVFIPFVRLILLAEPLFLPAGMFFMSVILIAVIFNLADKSGVPRRRLRAHKEHHSHF